MTENPADCGSQNGKAKSNKARIVAQVARIVRKEGLDYEGWRYVAKQVRKECELRPAKKGRRLPRVLTTEEFRRFYQVVDQAEDVQHALMLRLLFYTAVRVSELCNIAGRGRGPGSLQDQDQPGQGRQGPLRSLRQVLRHGPADAHRRPPEQPLAVPDAAARQVHDPPCPADRASTPRRPGSRPRRTRSGTKRSPG